MIYYFSLKEVVIALIIFINMPFKSKYFALQAEVKSSFNIFRGLPVLNQTESLITHIELLILSIVLRFK